MDLKVPSGSCRVLWALVGWKDVHCDGEAPAFVWDGLGGDILPQVVLSVPVLLLPGRVGQDMTGS